MIQYKNDPFMPVNDAVSDLTVDYCLNYFSIVAQTHPFFPLLNFLPASFKIKQRINGNGSFIDEIFLFGEGEIIIR